jgi:hypothetical protein
MNGSGKAKETAKGSPASSFVATMVKFLDGDDHNVRERPWSKCCTMATFFTQALSAGIISSLENPSALTAVVGGQRFIIMKGDQDDFHVFSQYVASRSNDREHGRLVGRVVAVRVLGEYQGEAEV